MNLDRMSRRSLLGTGALLTIEKAIGPTSAAQPVDAEEATVLQEGLIVPWKLQVSDETLADLRERLKLTRFPNQLADVPWVYGTDLAFRQNASFIFRPIQQIGITRSHPILGGLHHHYVRI